MIFLLKTTCILLLGLSCYDVVIYSSLRYLHCVCSFEVSNKINDKSFLKMF